MKFVGRPMQEALAELIRRIKLGEEFPDACASVAEEYGVWATSLRDEYDRAQEQAQ